METTQAVSLNLSSKLSSVQKFGVRLLKLKVHVCTCGGVLLEITVFTAFHSIHFCQTNVVYHLHSIPFSEVRILMCSFLWATPTNLICSSRGTSAPHCGQVWSNLLQCKVTFLEKLPCCSWRRTLLAYSNASLGPGSSRGTDALYQLWQHLCWTTC